ncbi:PHP domain protein [Limihaloglobus sulfuriphilus]|uniref:PHP domain protein n=1 Tax=Limihaloglobus sulfuriphilus TaxID=1851148 RepID=A0A1Q2MC01_9BACT|nr:CehA/McbA family metallohydrolase [Limihaloglobus sulfuriphilus]AQQ70243.1 PHP domain protein [Limihaloglobus sulfuriphilus]
MDRRAFIRTSGILTASAMMANESNAAEKTANAPAPLKNMVNPFEVEGKFYKAALHVHTTTSDGDVDVATRIPQYRKHGYDIVAITDHWKTNDLSGYSDEKFLAISGMEFHPKTGTGAPAHHLIALDIPHPLKLDSGKPAQELVDQVINAGGKVIYAHPYWTAHTLEEMSEITGYIAIEVFNAVCGLGAGKSYGNVHWYQIMNRGCVLPAVSVDDIHSSSNINLGWTMIKAKALNTADIMDAISKGSYYASCGPVIEDYRVENGTVSLKCSEASKIRFLYDGSGGGRTFNADKGKSITSASWKFGDSKRTLKWIRAEVIDSDGNFAWANPIKIETDKA